MADTKPLLDREMFKTIVDATPLVSIDLLVRNADNQILVGNCVNRPAQGFWFVPGGRILKNERLSEAFSRLTKAELGLELCIQQAGYLGLYEHFYPNSIFTDESADIAVSTHYIVNGFEIALPDAKHDLPVEQHSAYYWLTKDELMASNKMHVHSKWYFENDKGLFRFQ